MTKWIKFFSTIVVFTVLTACQQQTDSPYEPAVVTDITISAFSHLTVDQGQYQFTEEELMVFFPDLALDGALSQDFIFYLDLFEIEQDSHILTHYEQPQQVMINTFGEATFDGITFDEPGIYRFRIHQSPHIADQLAENDDHWELDARIFYFDVTVEKDEENRVLNATTSQTEMPLFVNHLTLPLEARLTELFESVVFRMRSQQALLMNLTTGEILFDHRANERIFPASVTKIMTTLIGVLHGDLEQTITVNADFDGLYLAQSMQAGFVQGEDRTFSEILHGVMLASGGEATETLANHVAGSYEGFVLLMNQMARELNMVDTHFVTATGLHDDNHYTTANDMAILLQYALEIPEFRTIFTTESYILETENIFTDILYSTFFRNAPTVFFNGGEIIGGRTGFTTQAGRCLASLATNGEEEFILITFGAPDEYDQQIGHILDALMIYEYFLSPN